MKCVLNEAGKEGLQMQWSPVTTAFPHSLQWSLEGGSLSQENNTLFERILTCPW